MFNILKELTETFSNDPSWLDELEKIFHSRSQKELFLWGSGQQAEVLINRIENHPDKALKISGVIDSNPGKWGKKIRGKTIQSPAEITNRDTNIIIASSNYYAEIYQQITKNKICSRRILPNIFL